MSLTKRKASEDPGQEAPKTTWKVMTSTDQHFHKVAGCEWWDSHGVDIVSPGTRLIATWTQTPTPDS